MNGCMGMSVKVKDTSPEFYLSTYNCIIQPTKVQDLEEIIQYDQQVFPCDRRKMLEKMIVAKGENCFVARNSG